jgi:hypothetical protein
MSEEKQIVIELTEDIGSPALGVCFERAVRYEGSVQTIRVFPAAPIDPKAPPLTPAELYEAVQMWVNRAPTKGPVWDNPNAALAEKDAEIARLKDKCNKAILEPHHPGGPWDMLHKATEENRHLKDQIVDLEKLSEIQKTTIDAQGKDLRKAEDLEKRNSQKWYTLQKEQLTFRDPERKVVCDIMANGFTMPEMAQKGPELFICPNIGCKPACSTCHASTPHLKDDCCDYSGVGGCAKCIPYKEPAKHDDTVDALRYAFSMKSPLQHLQDRVLGPADLMEKIRGLEDKTGRELSQAFAEVNRVLAEHKQINEVSRSVGNAQARQILNMQGQIMGLEKEVKDQREDYHAHIRQLVEENGAAHKTYETKIVGLEHRLGLAQDRIAEIHPSGCVPPAKSKPKSRLKTDRVKKVTK